MVVHSLVWRSPVAKLVEKLGQEAETSTDFRLHGRHVPWSQWIATPGPFSAVVVVVWRKENGIV